MEELDSSVDYKFQQIKDSLATKEDIAELKLAIKDLIEELTTGILSMRVEMEKRFNSILMCMIWYNDSSYRNSSCNT